MYLFYLRILGGDQLRQVGAAFKPNITPLVVLLLATLSNNKTYSTFLVQNFSPSGESVRDGKTGDKHSYLWGQNL